MTSMPMPSVTVVIPTISLDKWLDEALESILSQPGISLQLIVILDGVEDDKACPWMEDERITLLRNPVRLGVGRTLQRAMQEAQGEFVARLDADDLAKPGRLAQQAIYLRSHPDTVAVSAGTEVIDSQGNVTGRFPFTPSTDVRPALQLQNVVVQSAVMFRLKDFVAVGGYEPLVQMEDYHLWLKLAQRGKIALLANSLAQYRIHGSQLSLGAKPYGEHIAMVMSERRNLGKLLGTPAPVRWAKDATWIGVQYLRYYVLRPGKRLIRKVAAR